MLSDRFALSTEAYQMAGRGVPAEVVAPANRAAAGGLRPDLTLILDLPPDVGRARQLAAGKRLDRLDAESAEFHRRVIDYYLAVRGDGVRHLDGCLAAGPALAGGVGRGRGGRAGSVSRGGRAKEGNPQDRRQV